MQYFSAPFVSFILLALSMVLVMLGIQDQVLKISENDKKKGDR